MRLTLRQEVEVRVSELIQVLGEQRFPSSAGL